jgi:WD40 repeat protein
MRFQASMIRLLRLFAWLLAAVIACTALNLADLASSEASWGQANSSATSNSPRVDSAGRSGVDPYGDQLPPGAATRLGTIRWRSPQFVKSLTFTPDGTLLISASEQGARIWNPANGKLLRQLRGQQARILGSAAVSPDGKLIAFGGWDQSISGGAVFQTYSGKLLAKVGQPNKTLAADCFTGDGKLLAVHYVGSADDWLIHLFDPYSGNELRSFGSKPDHVERVMSSRDRKTLISVARNGAIRFWEAATGRELRTIWPHRSNGREGATAEVAFPGLALAALSADDTRLAIVQDAVVAGVSVPGTRVQVLDTVSCLKKVEFETRENRKSGISDSLEFLTFTPTGEQLLTAGGGRSLRVWEAETGKDLGKVDPPVEFFTGALAPDGRRFAFNLHRGVIDIRDLATGKNLNRMESAHLAAINAAHVSPDGQTIITVDDDGRYCRWDAQVGKLLWKSPSQFVRELTFVANGRALCTSGRDERLRLRDAESGRELTTYPLAQIASVPATSHDGKKVAVAQGRTILLLDALTGRELKRYGAAKVAAPLAFSIDDSAIVGLGSTLEIWEVATGRHETRSMPAINGRRGGLPLALSPDGRYAAFGGNDTHITTLDVETGEIVVSFQNLPKQDRLRGEVERVAFSRDGRTIAWYSRQNALIRLGELISGEERARFQGTEIAPIAAVTALTFAPDGSFLVSGFEDSSTLVWDLTGKSRLPAGRAALTEGDLIDCWNQLASTNASEGYLAMCRLRADPDRSVRFLGKQLQAAWGVDKERVARLIANLDSNQFQTREEATAEIERLGDRVCALLRASLAGKLSPEARRRIQQVLTRLSARRPERIRKCRILEVVESINTSSARKLIRSLAKESGDTWLKEEARQSLARLQAIN